MREKTVNLPQRQAENIIKFEKFKSRREELFRELKGQPEEINILNRQIVRFARCIIDKFGNRRDENQDYLAWHALTGSGVGDLKKFTKFDFPGDYSVEIFLNLETNEEREKLLQKLESIKE